MSELSFVSQSEFDRIEALELEATDRAALLATLFRINTLYMIARAGSGHIGTSFSSLDIMTWLQREELGASDVFFSSKGHDAPALYAVMIGLGKLPFDQLHRLRRLPGLPGHPDVGTPGIVTNTGSLGMGISKAKGMVHANRLSELDARIFVMTGDGELQEGQFWESLVSAANGRMGEITAIVDHNKLQSDTWVSKVSDLGDLERKFESFGWYTLRCDGHDFEALRGAFEALRRITDQPKLLIADTIKGRGVSFMEPTAMLESDALYAYHSGAPDVASYERALVELASEANRRLADASASSLSLESVPRDSIGASGGQRMVAAYSRALLEHGDRNERLVVLDADLVLDCGLIPFAKAFPDRFIECGIAEQDMVSQAGGLALRGYLPVVHSFACFLAARPNEQIYNNATEGRRIVYVGSLAGLLPGGPGHSHQSVRDISALAAMPGLELIEPCCEDEVALATAYVLSEAEGSCYLRLVSIPCEIPYQLPPGYRLEPGRGTTLVDGSDAVLFGYGPVLLPQAFEAAARLSSDHGVGIRVVNLPWLNRIDADWLRECVAGYSHVFTLDNHYVVGGQGEQIAARLAGGGLSTPHVRSFGVRDVPACGRNDEVLRAHRLDAGSLVADILEALGKA